MKNIEMTAVFEPCDEGGFIAYAQEIPGVNTQGETIDEAKENLADAVNMVFEEMSNNDILRASIQRGIDDSANGRVTPHSEVRKKYEKWL